MSDTRKKNKNWTVCNENSGTSISFDGAQLAVLMDIRDELQMIRGHLSSLEVLARCPNVKRGFVAMNKVRLHFEKRWPTKKSKGPASASRTP